jgi:hypothetical protein
VEPGNILKRIGGIKMAEVNSTPEQVIAELDFVEVIKKDKDGNLVLKRVY